MPYCLKYKKKSCCLNSSATAGSDNSFNSLTPPNLKCLNSLTPPNLKCLNSLTPPNLKFLYLTISAA